MLYKNIILSLAILCNSCLSAIAKDSSTTDSMPDYFEVKISNKKLNIKLPVDLRNYLLYIISTRGRHQKPSMAVKIPVGKFVIRGKEYHWYGKNILFSSDSLTMFPTLYCFNVGYPETERNFPEILEFGIGGGSFNENVPEADKIEVAYKKFIPYLNRCVRQAMKDGHIK